MKQTFVIRTNQPDYPRVTTTGLLTPVPGLAITDVAPQFAHVLPEYPIVVTHVATGLGLAWFRDSESAAGYVLAMADVADWLLVDPDPGFKVADVAHKARIAWGGLIPRTGGGAREPIDDA